MPDTHYVPPLSSHTEVMPARKAGELKATPMNRKNTVPTTQEALRERIAERRAFINKLARERNCVEDEFFRHVSRRAAITKAERTAGQTLDTARQDEDARHLEALEKIPVRTLADVAAVLDMLRRETPTGKKVSRRDRLRARLLNGASAVVKDVYDAMVWFTPIPDPPAYTISRRAAELMAAESQRIQAENAKAPPDQRHAQEMQLLSLFRQLRSESKEHHISTVELTLVLTHAHHAMVRLARDDKDRRYIADNLRAFLADVAEPDVELLTPELAEAFGDLTAIRDADPAEYEATTAVISSAASIARALSLIERTGPFPDLAAKFLSILRRNAKRLESKMFRDFIGDLPAETVGQIADEYRVRKDAQRTGDAELMQAWEKFRTFHTMHNAPDTYDDSDGDDVQAEADREELDRLARCVEQAPATTLAGLIIKARYALLHAIQHWGYTNEELDAFNSPNLPPHANEDGADHIRGLWQVVDVAERLAQQQTASTSQLDTFADTVAAFETEAPAPLCMPQAPSDAMAEAGAAKLGISKEQFRDAYMAAADAYVKERAA